MVKGFVQLFSFYTVTELSERKHSHFTGLKKLDRLWKHCLNVKKIKVSLVEKNSKN